MTVLIGQGPQHAPGVELDTLVAERLGWSVFLAGAPVPADVTFPCVAVQPQGFLVVYADATTGQPWSPSRDRAHAFGLMDELRARGFIAGLRAFPDHWRADAMAGPTGAQFAAVHATPEMALCLMFIKATGPLVTLQ